MKLGLNGRFYAARPTGVQRFAREITERLQRQTNVTLFLPHGAAVPLGVNGRARQVKGVLWCRWWEQLELPLRVRAAGCDVVLHLAQSAPLARHRSVVMVHDLTPLTNPEWYRPGFRLWFRAALAGPARRAARVLAASRWTRGEVLRLLEIAPERVDVVSQGAEPFDRPADAAAVDRVRAQCHLPDGYLLAVGWGDARKNAAFLLDVLRRWPQGAARPSLVITGAAYPHLHAIGPLPRHDDLNVRLLGHVDEGTLQALYTGSAAFCFPSLAEGFGRPPLEAMGCGAPVVAADYPTAAEVLGDAGLILPLDADLWARTLVRLLASAGERAEWRERGRRRAACFAWDAATEQVLSSCRAAADSTFPVRAG